jgi:hypothetical protein
MVEEYKNGKVVGKVTETLFGAEEKDQDNLLEGI